ncbi:hypothetical protein F4778DRAFT_422973 [Xylariomycetidae sp. FL2044]|nr:hypothetical protein F4778DRAFT_422973 [Xylariomycetidae sp. FL2044]
MLVDLILPLFIFPHESSGASRNTNGPYGLECSRWRLFFFFFFTLLNTKRSEPLKLVFTVTRCIRHQMMTYASLSTYYLPRPTRLGWCHERVVRASNRAMG